MSGNLNAPSGALNKVLTFDKVFGIGRAELHKRQAEERKRAAKEEAELARQGFEPL